MWCWRSGQTQEETQQFSIKTVCLLNWVHLLVRLLRGAMGSVFLEWLLWIPHQPSPCKAPLHVLPPRCYSGATATLTLRGIYVLDWLSEVQGDWAGPGLPFLLSGPRACNGVLTLSQGRWLFFSDRNSDQLHREPCPSSPQRSCWPRQTASLAWGADHTPWAQWGRRSPPRKGPYADTRPGCSWPQAPSDWISGARPFCANKTKQTNQTLAFYKQ